MTKFSTNLTPNYLGTVVRVDGSSSAKWFGTSPFNASAITLKDTIWANSLSFTSINVGSSPSAGISVTGNAITYSSNVSNSWQNNHYYAGWEFSGLLLNINQSATASYRFGSKTFFQTVN